MRTILITFMCLHAQLAALSPAHGSPADDKLKKAATDALARSADEKVQQAISRGDFREAAALLKESVKRNPDDFAAQRTLGWIYLDKLHDPQAAYHHLVIAAKGQPNDLDSRKLLALACSQTGRTREAAAEFQQAAVLAPDDMWVRANLGRSLARLRRYKDAEAIYVVVLKTDPSNVDARLGQAELAAWRGRSTAALEILDPLVKENPQNVEALALMADIHRWNWDLTEAKQEYAQVLKISEEHYGARIGLTEAKRMAASDVHAKGYYFEDKSDLIRESVEAGTRIHLTDNVYLLGRGVGWRFKNPGFENVDRIDGMGGLEVDWARWLETSVEGGVFDYENRDPWVGGRFFSKLSPTPRCDLYAVASYRQPFVSSIVTISDALKEDSVGSGLDIKLGGRLSLQSSLQLARISDDNEWWQAKPQLSFRLFGNPNRPTRPAAFVRAEYDYLSYSESRTNYWTPNDRHVASPVLDCTIPFGRYFRIVGVGKAPYVFSASKFGWQVEGGPVLDLGHRLQLKGSYIQSSIPADGDIPASGVQQPPWSGRGGQVALLFRF